YKITYKNQQLLLDDIYQAMLLTIETDEDLKDNFDTAIARIKNILSSTPCKASELSQELNQLFNNPTINQDLKRQVIIAILNIIRVKPFWSEKIIVESQKNLPEIYLLSPEACRDNLMLNIAKFYASKYQKSSAINHQYHVCQWIKYLYEL
ncbi:MAG: hypothetical protein AAFN00_08880, partial [Cyanobacteria bacterium J06558_2]